MVLAAIRSRIPQTERKVPMSETIPCELLWTEKPSELFKTNLHISEICESSNMNAFSRATLIALVISAILFPFLGILGFALSLLVLIVLYGSWLFTKKASKSTLVFNEVLPGKEGFESGVFKIKNGDAAAAPVITSPGVVTRPTAVNPFMNVLLDEIKYNPTRPAADFASDPNNQAVLDDFFRVQWTSDPTDVFGKTQSQREFYTMPSTSIPNDRESYQNWLYLIPGMTCKEGGRDACYPGTNGGPIPWLGQTD
jgi:hypothetical protein